MSGPCVLLTAMEASGGALGAELLLVHVPGQRRHDRSGVQCERAHSALDGNLGLPDAARTKIG